MLGLFKKKEPSVKIIDKIWVYEEDKWKACVDMAKANEAIIFCAWFDETAEHLSDFFQKENIDTGRIVLAKQSGSALTHNKTIIFIEHYPLRSREQALFLSLNLEEVQVFSALNEPLFKQFGSDRIIAMMKQLGMNEKTVIENNLVTNAIRNAQEKIEKKVGFEQSARSATDWLGKNFTP